MKPIQALLCIMLVAAALSTAHAATHAAADPPAEAPSIPYVIELRINMPDGTPAQGAAFSAVNTRNGDAAQGAVNENGTYTFSMTYHKDGDTVRITASKPGLTGSTTIRLTKDASGTQTQMPHVVSITLRPPESTPEEGISLQQAATAAGIATAAILGVMLVRKRKGGGGEDRKKGGKDGGEAARPTERPKRKRSR